MNGITLSVNDHDYCSRTNVLVAGYNVFKRTVGMLFLPSVMLCFTSSTLLGIRRSPEEEVREIGVVMTVHENS